MFKHPKRLLSTVERWISLYKIVRHFTKKKIDIMCGCFEWKSTVYTNCMREETDDMWTKYKVWNVGSVVQVSQGNRNCGFHLGLKIAVYQTFHCWGNIQPIAEGYTRLVAWVGHRSSIAHIMTSVHLFVNTIVPRRWSLCARSTPGADDRKAVSGVILYNGTQQTIII